MLTIDINNVWSDILYDENYYNFLKTIFNEELRIKIPNAEYLWTYKSGQWDGKAELWEEQNRAIRIRSGLVPRVIDLFNQNNIKWRAGVDGRLLPVTSRLNKTQVALRNYQFKATKAAFSNTQSKFGYWPRGIIEAATGSGKTEIAVAMFEMNNVPTFFLVHRKDLLIQAKERFEKYGHKVGIIGNNKFDPASKLNIATMQTLQSIFNDPYSSRANILAVLIQDCKQVFFDESHLMASSLEKGNEFVKIADQFEAPFRWGLTATPFMREKYDNMLLEGVTGKSLYKITTEELVKKGYLTPPKVIMKHVPGTLLVSMDWRRNSTKAKAEYWRKVEEKGIKFNEIRTNLIIDEMMKGPYPLIVLVKTVEQAEFIKKLFSLNSFLIKRSRSLLFLSGKDTAKKRREAVKHLKDGTLDMLLATTIFDEGVDIPELRKVILASGGKSQVKAIQRVGRVLRRAKGKKEAIIVDFKDEHHSMLKKHAEIRKQVYLDQKFKVIND